MGADIHYTIEAQDANNTWHVLYASGLYYTAWWQSRFMQGRDRYDDPHGLSAIEDRDYYRFGLLSGVRRSNPFAPALGTACGIANSHACEGSARTGAVPPDATALSRAEMEHHHSVGSINGADIDTLIAGLTNIIPTRNPTHEDGRETQETGLLFLKLTKTAMILLAGQDGTPGLVGSPILHVPDDDYNDSDAPVLTKGASMHHIFPIIAELRSGQGIPLDRMRIIIGYDS